MNEQQLKALKQILDAILEAVAACPMGAPAGPMYASLMSQVCTLNQFESIMGGLVRAGKLRQQGDLYFTA